jgi:hypothetical protein
VAVPRWRGGIPQGGQHHPGVAELEPDQEKARGELPRFGGQGDAGEDDSLHDGASDDHRRRLSYRPNAPKRTRRSRRRRSGS